MFFPEQKSSMVWPFVWQLGRLNHEKTPNVAQLLSPWKKNHSFWWAQKSTNVNKKQFIIENDELKQFEFFKQTFFIEIYNQTTNHSSLITRTPLYAASWERKKGAQSNKKPQILLVCQQRWWKNAVMGHKIDKKKRWRLFNLNCRQTSAQFLS